MESNDNKKDVIRYYCTPCKIYISTDTFVKDHLNHETIDLAEKSTRFLANYQKLSQMASLLANRRQVHIKDESIPKIMDEIRGKVLDAKINLQKDIGKSIEETANFLLNNPLVQEMSRKKAELAGKDDEELTEVKEE